MRLSATLEIVDLERNQLDLAVRFVTSSAGDGPLLFEEEVLPVCSPQLLRDPRRPLKTPTDLEHHTLLTVDKLGGAPTADWEPWLRLSGLETVSSANTMRFTLYSEAVAAACTGQGVVIGRLPLLAELVRDGKLVAPFRSRAASRRGYFVMSSPQAAHNADAQDFIRWLVAEAAQVEAPVPDTAGSAPPGKKKRKA